MNVIRVLVLAVLSLSLLSVSVPTGANAFPVHTEVTIPTNCVHNFPTWTSNLTTGWSWNGTAVNRSNLIRSAVGGLSSATAHDPVIVSGDFDIAINVSRTQQGDYVSFRFGPNPTPGPTGYSAANTVGFYWYPNNEYHIYQGTGGGITDLNAGSLTQPWLWIRTSRAGSTWTWQFSTNATAPFSWSAIFTWFSGITANVFETFEGTATNVAARYDFKCNAADPRDFTLQSSIHSTSFRVNDVAHATISASGKANLTGAITLSASSTMFGSVGITVVCFPTSVRINVSTSDCTLNSMFAGIFNVTITGTNATVGKSHSVYIDVTVLATSVAPTIDANAMVFIVFIILIIALIVMAFIIHPVFAVFAGVVTEMFAIWIFSATSNTIITFIVGSFGAMLFVTALFIQSDRW